MTYNLHLTHFETTDNLLLPGILYEPKVKTDRIALYLHGNGSSSVFYNSDTMNPFGETLTKGNGRNLVPKSILEEPLISYQSLYDTINPDGDYNIFPFNESMNNLKFSKKPLFKEYKTIDKSTLVVYGENDEYCYGDVPRCVEILKKECPDKKLFTFNIIKGADHGFTGKEKELADVIGKWL